MFETPSFSFWNVLYTAIGAAVFWAKWGRTRLKAYVLSDILNVLPLHGHLRAAVELLIFIMLGCIVGIGVASPSTAVQAITAGFGWTGLFAYQPRSGISKT